MNLNILFLFMMIKIFIKKKLIYIKSMNNLKKSGLIF